MFACTIHFYRTVFGVPSRIALVRALLVSLVFLFADEATSRLDPVTQKEVVDLLMGVVADRRLGMLLVTHDGVLADRVADRVLGLALMQVQP
jgi:peptide/nickel transport system ATP-binding protein